GADLVLRYDDNFPARIRDWTGDDSPFGPGADVVFDGVGAATFDDSLRCAARASAASWRSSAPLRGRPRRWTPRSSTNTARCPSRAPPCATSSAIAPNSPPAPPTSWGASRTARCGSASGTASRLPTPTRRIGHCRRGPRRDRWCWCRRRRQARAAQRENPPATAMVREGSRVQGLEAEHLGDGPQD